MSGVGEIRYTNGAAITDKLYTGQQQESEIGLDYYVARFYDPAIAHFVQMDSLVPEPGTLKAFDRYAYVLNSPIVYNDPTGHCYNYSTPQNAAICNAYWKQYEEAMRKKYVITAVAPSYSTLPVVTSKDYSTLNSKNTIQPKVNDCGPWAASAQNTLFQTAALENYITQSLGNPTPNVFELGGGGIQPVTQLAPLTQDFFTQNNMGGYSVASGENATIVDMRHALSQNQNVIVDIMVSGLNYNYSVGLLEDRDTDFAHFARVLKVDIANNSITLTNSVSGGTWDVLWSDYLSASTNPEGQVGHGGRPIDVVNQWMMTISYPSQ